MSFSCMICMECCNVSELCALKCGHAFHRPCIKRWLDSNRFCPSCRAPSSANSMRRLLLNVATGDGGRPLEYAGTERVSESSIYDLLDENEKLEKRLSELHSEIKSGKKNCAAITADLKLLRKSVEDLSKAETDNALLKKHLTHMKRENEILKQLTELFKADNFVSCFSDIKDVASLQFCLEVLKRKHKEIVTSCSKESEESRRANRELASIRRANEAMRCRLMDHCVESSCSSDEEVVVQGSPAARTSCGTRKRRRSVQKSKRSRRDSDEDDYFLSEDDESGIISGFSMSLRSGTRDRVLRSAFSSSAPHLKRSKRR